MTITIAQLLRALPVDDAGETTRSDERLVSRLADIESTRPIPTGTFKRLSLLGSLQAKLALAYGFHWIRGFFQDADSRQRDAAETHCCVALPLHR